MTGPSDKQLAGAGNDPQSSHGLPDVDLARLAEITGGDRVLRRGLVDTFIQSGQRALADIGSGLPKNDRERVCRAAHTLKGAAANMGAASLQRAAAALEAASRTEPEATLADLAGSVASEFASARSIFEQELQRP